MGGSVIQMNVMANLCRESGDHGPFKCVPAPLAPISPAAAAIRSLHSRPKTPRAAQLVG